MNKIASFNVDHEKLTPGVYVERQDSWDKKTITTFGYIAFYINKFFFYSTYYFCAEDSFNFCFFYVLIWVIWYGIFLERSIN